MATLSTQKKEKRYLTNRNTEVTGMLIKKHSVDLLVQGEFSFPNSVKSWHRVLDVDSTELENSLLACIGKESEDIVKESKRWKVPLRKVLETKDRVHLFMNRCSAISIGLEKSKLNNGFIKEALSKNMEFVLLDKGYAEYCTTSLRLKCMKCAANNLIKLCFDAPDEIQHLKNIVITPKSLRKDNTVKFILCGTVLNAKTNLKETNISAEEFIRIRQNELMLIAQHKYGVRVSTDSKWKEFIAHLGESAVTFELLQTKPSSAVKINFDTASGSSKGAAFILYNCARLETILRTYNEKVNDETYPPLPDFEKTDFSLLTQEEPRKHLLPVMFARLHMLNILNDTLKTCLRILNIKSVSQM